LRRLDLQRLRVRREGVKAADFRPLAGWSVGANPGWHCRPILEPRPSLLDLKCFRFSILADVDDDGVTIAEAAARCGLPESTLRYWERIGLVRPVPRDVSSGHRRYDAEDVATLETLGNLRAVGLSIEDMRAYLAGARRGDDAAGEQRALFEAHARHLADELAALEVRRRYLDLKVHYWSAREAGDLDKAAAVAAELGPITRRMRRKDIS
jgi:MerR family transcriptional regulator, aldehyde-responsive regulator